MSSDLHNYGIIGFTADNVGIDRRIYTGLTSTDPVLNVSYNGGRVDVYLNGIKLVGDHSEMPSGTRDYTFTQTGQGSSIQLRTGVALVSADVVECIGHVSGSGKTVNTYTPSVSAGSNTFNSSTTGMNGFTLQGSDLLNVYLNGVLLDSSDYTSDASADSVTITNLASGDVVHIQVIGALDYANFVPASGGAFTGPITGVDVNGTELVLDVDGDTSITADTDDRIDIKIGGTDVGNFNSDTLKLTKDNTPKLIVEDTNSGDVTLFGNTFWVTAPELQLNHNTSDANADGVIGNIKFKGTTKNNLGITTSNNTISQIEGRSFEASGGVGQRVTDMKSGFRFKGYDGAGNYGDTLILKGKDLQIQNSGGITISTTSHTFTVKGSDHNIGDSQSGTAPDTTDSDSGQFAVYNGSTKLFGITEHGYVLKPNQPSFLIQEMNAESAGTFLYAGATLKHNNGNHYSTSTGRFTAPISGFYFISGGVLTNSANNRVETAIYVNTNIYLHGNESTGSSAYGGAVCSGIAQLSAGDYVAFKLVSGSMYGNHQNNYFSAHLLS